MSITQETRRASHQDIQEKVRPRREVIYSILPPAPDGMTAEEIADALLKRGLIRRFDMNYVRPRLTELKSAGAVEVVGKRKSYRTGKDTAVWARKQVEVNGKP